MTSSNFARLAALITKAGPSSAQFPNIRRVLSSKSHIFPVPKNEEIL